MMAAEAGDPPSQSPLREDKQELPSSPSSRKKDKVVVLLTDTARAKELLDGVYLAAVNDTPHGNQSVLQGDKSVVAQSGIEGEVLCYYVSEKMFCSYCATNFTDRLQQKSHYKTDWHRYNLKLKLRGMEPLSQERFEDVVAGDISSISGSEGNTSSDEDEDEHGKSDVKEKHPISNPLLLEKRAPESSESESEMSAHVEGIGRRHPRVFLRNNIGQLLSIYRCVIHGKKNQPSEQEELVTMVKEMPEQMKWVMFMTAGGHFAGAVFQSDQVIEHKTFHRYTVRAKRGTAQGSRDKQGNAPHSAGASLRRYNETALTEDVAGLITSWSEHMKSCHRIFLRAPSFNRTIFFGGKNPPLDKKDPRIRLIPFPTRRPTFNELRRVHSVLASIECHGGNSTIRDHIRTPSPRKATKYPDKNKSREQQKMVTPEEITGTIDKTESDEDADDECTLVFEEQVIQQLDSIQQFAATRKPRKKKKNPGEKDAADFPGPRPAATVEEDSIFGVEQQRLRDQLYTSCKTGNIDDLRRLLAPLLPAAICEQSDEPDVPCADSGQEGGSQSHAATPPGGEGGKHVAEGNHDSVSGTGCESYKDPKARSRTFSPGNITSGTDKEQVEGVTLTVINQSFGEKQHTLLHVASMGGFDKAVSLLLHAGADPTTLDNLNQPPYLRAADKVTRNAFRRFMAEYPDKFDYSTTKIPTPLSSEKEAEKKARDSERKKAQRKAKKDRLKDKKAEGAAKAKEEQEMQRFLKLSEREKRALAAERRLTSQLQSQGEASPILSRCWQCGTDITGRVPFEYYDYKFCTPRCLKDHKLANISKRS